MPVIVAERTSGARYLLVGTGYAATESATPGIVFGNLSPNVECRVYGMVALCDLEGNIGWTSSDNVVVVAIDGLAPAEALDGRGEVGLP